jgi:uncharacterized PurR-regulated membrane protein YhhQ (DUF165 family)
MKFKDLFKDSNDINEKSVVGFCAFALMVLFALTDLVTGYFGKDLVISEVIYNSLLVLVLGSFGISGVEKIMNRKTDNSSENPEEN